MNWLFSITYYSPYVSGLTIYVKRLAEELMKKGHQVSILCMKHEDSLSTSEEINLVDIHRAKVVMRLNKGFVSIDWIIKSWIQVRKCDVLVVNLPQVEGWIPVLMARVFRKKVIAVYHCEINLPNKFIQWWVEQANWLSLELAEKIVSYTQDYADNSRLVSKYPDKLSYIYPPIPDLAVDEKLKKELEKKIGPGPVVGVAARLAREKGIEYLIEALPMIKTKVKIAIAGPIEPVGEKEYKEKILKLAKQYKGRVIFLGTIDPEKMGAFYGVIDVLVLPSINSTEAFGMVQVEAMLKGVPVIATNLPGVRVPVQISGMGLVVSPKDSKGIAGAIERILKDKIRFTKYMRNVMSEFNLGRTVSFFEKL